MLSTKPSSSSSQYYLKVWIQALVRIYFWSLLSVGSACGGAINTSMAVLTSNDDPGGVRMNCPQGYNKGEGDNNGMCYKFFYISVPFEEAKKKCSEIVDRHIEFDEDIDDEDDTSNTHELATVTEPSAFHQLKQNCNKTFWSNYQETLPCSEDDPKQDTKKCYVWVLGQGVTEQSCSKNSFYICERKAIREHRTDFVVGFLLVSILGTLLILLCSAFYIYRHKQERRRVVNVNKTDVLNRIREPLVSGLDNP